MSKFKVGDVVWYFTFPEDGCGGFDVNAIELHKYIIADEKELNYPYLNYAYKTKDLAISAFDKRLEDFLRIPI